MKARSDFIKRNTKKEEQSVLAFKERTVPEPRKGTPLKNKMRSKTSLVKKKEAKKRLKDHFMEHNRMPKFWLTKYNTQLKKENKIEIWEML